MQLHDKTILLTGANGGLGREIAQRLAAKGARLILAGYGQAELEKLAISLSDEPLHHCALSVDLSSQEGIDDLVSFCAGQPSGIDVLINSAGLNRFELIDEADSGFLNRMFTVNLIAPVSLTAKLLPMLKSRREAMIVNIGSVLGAIGNPGYSAYCASKAGLARFSESLRRELADSNVSVLHLNPRVIQTTMNSGTVNRLNERLGNRADTPGDVAAHLLKLIGAGRSSESSIGWPEKLFVKVNALLPGLVDRSFRKTLPVITQAARQEAAEAAPAAEPQPFQHDALASRR